MKRSTAGHVFFLGDLFDGAKVQTIINVASYTSSFSLTRHIIHISNEILLYINPDMTSSCTMYVSLIDPHCRY